MKGLTRLLNKLKNILTGKRGESLMESIASILILNILMLAVTVMIKTSLRITEQSTTSASSIQEQANSIIFEEYPPSADTPTLELRDSGSGYNIDVDIEVIYHDDGTFQAFTPASSGVT